MRDEAFIKRIRELSEQAFYGSRSVFTDFLTPGEQSEVLTLAPKLSTRVTLFGGYELAERKVACFGSPPEAGHEVKFPIDILRVSPIAEKYAEDLTHRDYLGALLNLGIDRRVTGDIVPDGKYAWIFCLEHMSDFISESLLRVRHTAVRVHKADSLSGFSLRAPREIYLYIHSLRLDAYISKVFKISRDQAQKYLRSEKVFVNSLAVTKADYMLKSGDLVSVRGLGRFRHKDTISGTKKGNLRVTAQIW